jgi:hypothetical protein
MAPDILVNGMVKTYLASPQGQKTIHSYLSSAEGQVMIKNYLATRDGKQTARLLLPAVFDHLNLPDDVKEKIRIALTE